MGRLDGRTVVITGAARGQGAQEARLFHAEGANVLLADVLDEQNGQLARELGDRAAAVHLDVRSEDEWAAAAATAKERFGRVDGLVNNAGILHFAELTGTTLADYRQIVDVNQVGCFLGMRTLAPDIAAAGGGTIVNTASYVALSGMQFLTAYAASKAAILGMTRVAALELAGRDIRVNALCPGAVDTPMTNPAQVTEHGLPGSADGADAQAARDGMDQLYAKVVPQGRAGRPEEIARLALFLTAGDSSYVTGQPVVADGGWLAGVQLF